MRTGSAPCRRRDLVTRLFDELLPGCFYVRPRGAFYLYFRVDHVFDREVTCVGDVCTRILEEVGVGSCRARRSATRASPA